MGDHIVVDLNKLSKNEASESNQIISPDVVNELSCKNPEIVGSSSSSTSVENNKVTIEVGKNEEDEHAPLIGNGECRICQEEDSLKNLESPCDCNGSLKYAHRKCVQHWCDEKGDIICEICHKPYQPGYTALPRPPPDETNIHMGGIWQISGTPVDVNDPRLRAIAEAERQLFADDYDDVHGTHSNGAAFLRSAALVLIALLLLKHALSLTDGDNDDGDDAYTFFSLFLLRVVGFLLPCYIMIWAISILQRRRQRQEAAALAAARLAIVVHRRGLVVTPPDTSRQVPALDNV